LGYLYQSEGQYQAALKHYSVLEDRGNGSQRVRALTQMLACRYELGEYERLPDILGDITAIDSTNIQVAAYSSFLSEQLGTPDRYPFCPIPLNFFYSTNIAKHCENKSVFINQILNEVDKIPKTWEPRNKATNNGFQTRDGIFEAGNYCRQLKDIIRTEIDSYFTKFETEKCLFIRDRPAQYRLGGWFVRLMKYGYQEPHIHDSGWLSGVFYLKTVQTSSINEGAIELSLQSPNSNRLQKTTSKLIFQPQIGDIIFFPSSVFHSTIPFETDEDRCVIAFDVYPVR
jgi:hypothetical protein